MGGKIQTKMIEDYTDLLIEGLETVKEKQMKINHYDTTKQAIQSGYIAGLNYAISLANDMKKATKEGFDKQ